jgi:hypothetical protein
MQFDPRTSRARVRVRRCSRSSEVVQIFERRQVSDFELYPEALRMLPQFLMERGTLLKDIVEWLCTTSAIMARAEYGHIARIFLHPIKRDMSCDMDARSSRTGTSYFPTVMANKS